MPMAGSPKQKPTSSRPGSWRTCRGRRKLFASWAQQGAEKYLKGYLVWHSVTFRMLEILNNCRTVDGRFGELVDDCQTLNPYAVEVRYPGFGTSYTDEDARDALERAERVRRFVRTRLGLNNAD